MINKLFIINLVFITICSYGQVEFEYDNSNSISISEAGKINVENINENATLNSTENLLVFDKDGTSVLTMENTNSTINLKSTYTAGKLPSQMPLMGLQITHDANGTLAEISEEGELLSTEKSRTLVSAVTYIESFSVYEEIGSNADVTYVNFNTPSGVEGRIQSPVKNPTSNFYLKDHLGSTRAVIKKSENSLNNLQTLAYQPYGSQIIIDNSGEPNVRETFTGKEFDTEGSDENGAGGINAYYFGARYYDPELGIWHSADAAKQFWNPYAYHVNPILYTDPDGNYFGIDDIFMIGINAISAGIDAEKLQKGSFWKGFGLGAAVGISSSYLGGAISKALGTNNAGKFGSSALLSGMIYGATTTVANGFISGRWLTGNGVTVEDMLYEISAGTVSGGVGGVVSDYSISLADIWVGEKSLGRFRSVLSETTIRAIGAASANGVTQQLMMTNDKYQFDHRAFLSSIGASVLNSSINIASQGYLRDSRSAAREYFGPNPKALERFKKVMPDPYENRFRFYREGGRKLHREKGTLGLYQSRPGLKRSKPWHISNYNKTLETFVHEISHGGQWVEQNGKVISLSTTDYTFKENAYAFETWVTGFQTSSRNSELRSANNNAVYWLNGVPYDGRPQRNFENKITNENYTDWDSYWDEF